TTLRISRPKSMKSLSMNATLRAARSPPARTAKPSASSTRSRYRGSSAACSRSEGLVVASCGRCSAMASMSPVSATTAVQRFRDSTRFIGSPLVGGHGLGEVNCAKPPSSLVPALTLASRSAHTSGILSHLSSNQIWVDFLDHCDAVPKLQIVDQAGMLVLLPGAGQLEEASAAPLVPCAGGHKLQAKGSKAQAPTLALIFEVDLRQAPVEHLG